MNYNFQQHPLKLSSTQADLWLVTMGYSKDGICRPFRQVHLLFDLFQNQGNSIPHFQILFSILFQFTMSSKIFSQGLTLQVPGFSSTRSLQPPGPARTQPGFVVPPNDSRHAVTFTADDESSGPLSHRPASPRPPAVTNKKKTVPQAKAKPKPKPPKGKVCWSLQSFT